MLTQDTLRQTAGKLGYLQTTAPVLTAGAEADDIIHAGGSPVNDFGVEAVKVLTLLNRRIRCQIKREAAIPAWG